jgi:AmmeMemoRadiSam system protein B/AmmeMemoRadiSam system protein A
MKTTFGVMLVSLVMLIAVTGAAKTRVRQPAVAGQFYPSDPTKLANAIDIYIADALPPAKDKPLAIVSPHAGYVFSGQIAADAFKQAEGHDYDLVVIIGTNHTTAGFGDISIYPGGGYRTPLGIAEIDGDLASDLTAANDDFTFNKSVHEREHSVEVQIPFVQVLFPDAKILTAVIGSPDPDLCHKFGEELAERIKNRNALIVASTDLSHFPNHRDACQTDWSTLEAIFAFDSEAFHAATRDQLRLGRENLSTCACGAGPVLAVLAAAERCGVTGVNIISYATSGDTSFGTRDRVVGYGAVAFSRGAPVNNVNPPGEDSSGEAPAEGADIAELSDSGKQALLAFARKTIQQYVTSETAPLARGFEPALRSEHGVFVTLRKNGRLRGCIGHMADDLPVCQAVGYCAIQAAFNDRRFTPLEPGELHDIDIEISILTPYRQAQSYKDIRIGRDGVLIEKNGRSAVYLPSVPVEQGWEREEMLEHLCRKAGLSEDAWKKGTTFYTFQTIEFGESHSH